MDKNNSYHADQAKHNIKFLEYFYGEFKFNDWAITVSFYIAIHIVEVAICKAKSLKLFNQTIAISHSAEVRQLIKNGKLKPLSTLTEATFTAHAIRNQIVRENFMEISAFFDLLYKNSKTSRYRQYQWDNNDTKLIVPPALAKIVQWCNEAYKTDFSINLK